MHAEHGTARHYNTCFVDGTKLMKIKDPEMWSRPFQEVLEARFITDPSIQLFER
jgi:hypothetical protein